MRLGIREGGLHRLLGQSVVKSKGSLEHGSNSVIEGEREAAIRRPSWYEMTLMDQECRLS